MKFDDVRTVQFWPPFVPRAHPPYTRGILKGKRSSISVLEKKGLWEQSCHSCSTKLPPRKRVMEGLAVGGGVGWGARGVGRGMSQFILYTRVAVQLPASRTAESAEEDTTLRIREEGYMSAAPCHQYCV